MSGAEDGGLPPNGDRLETWKEIAAYLRRDVRTVQRWEQAYGLPIHRQPRARRPLPYAYKSELDAWRRGSPFAAGEPEAATDRNEPQSQSPDVAPVTHSSSVTRRAIRLRPLAISVATIGVAGLIAVGVSVVRHSATANLHEPTLVAPFANHTGEPVFDWSLEGALARELEASGVVSLVPPERVQDTLRLMRRPTDIPLDKATAIEVCRRDGSIRVLLAGVIDRVGPGYSLTVELIRAMTNESIATIEEDAPDRGAVIPAVRRVAARIRASLGEQHEKIDRDSAALEKVTTPSLEALRLYTEATAALSREQEQVAIELLQQTIAIDPDFAMAHALLAWAISGNGGSPEDIERSSRRGWDAADRATDLERLFIRGTYYFFANQRGKALADCQALLQMQPGNYWALKTAVTIYRDWHNLEGAIPYIVRIADLRPRDLGANVLAFNVLETIVRDHVRAAEYFRRADALVDAGREGVSWNGAWIKLHPAFAAWMADDATEASRLVDAFSRDPRRAVAGAGRARFLAGWYVALGRLRDAASWLDRVPPDRGGGDRLTIAIARDDAETVRTILSDFIARRLPIGITAALVAERVGFPSAPRLIAERIRHEPEWYPYRDAIDGEAALVSGDRVSGVELLGRTWNDMQAAPEAISFLAIERLARAYDEEGHLDRAIDVLERAGLARDRAYTLAGSGPATLYFWMRTQDLLAQAYRKGNRPADARRIEHMLLKLLAVADQDHVMLRAIKERQALHN